MKCEICMRIAKQLAGIHPGDMSRAELNIVDILVANGYLVYDDNGELKAVNPES